MKLRYKILWGVVLLLAVALSAGALALQHDTPCATAPAAAGAGAGTMKAIVQRCYGPAEVLKLEEIPKPSPAADEILVKVHAASVNPLDWHYLHGTPYLMRLDAGVGLPADARFGVDFAGTVEQVGAKVTRFKPGDEVFGGRTGAFAEYVVVKENRAVAHKPANVSFEQAAAVPIAGVTALQALRDKGGLKPGQRVLVNGASGGVGTFAVQLAHAFGAEVTGVCSTRNLELVRALGADHVIDYTREDFTRSSTHYDLIIDTVGNHPLLAYRRVLTPRGTLVIVGGPSDDNWLGPLVLLGRALLIAPFVSQSFEPFLAHLNQDDLELLGKMMESGKVTPVLDRRYPLPQVPAALRYLEAGHARGKVIVAVTG